MNNTESLTERITQIEKLLASEDEQVGPCCENRGNRE